MGVLHISIETDAPCAQNGRKLEQQVVLLSAQKLLPDTSGRQALCPAHGCRYVSAYNVSESNAYNISKLNAYKVNTGGKKIIEARAKQGSEQRANKRTVRRFSKGQAKGN